jgi:hypothetical protein
MPPSQKEKATDTGRLIKYMGASDVRRIAKGEDFGGQLADPIESDLEWNWDNNHVVDVDEAGLSEDALDLLLALPLVDPVIVNPKTGEPVDIGGVPYPQGAKEFKDVTGLKKHPVNLASSLWRGVKELNESSVQSVTSSGVAGSPGAGGSADISGTAPTGSSGGGTAATTTATGTGSTS